MSDKNHHEKEDFWKTSMQTLKIRKMVIDIEERLPQIISEWYFEQGLPEPQWRQRKPYFDKDGNIVDGK